MTLDQYSYCPCGNGKKIKFCKCNEHFQEMQTVERMIAGEQFVAALDRINADLKSMPSEPWLLAMKCQLLLQLQEFEPLEETSAKFIRLQPDNPLAKLFRAIVAVIRGNTEEGTALFLQAIADSSEVLPSMTATVAVNLLEMMGQRGMIMSGLLFSELLLDMGEPIAQYAAGAYESFITQNRASVLARESLPSPLSADDEPFAERIAEVEALVANYRISLGKTKLESMLREFGQAAPILQRLLLCQLLLTDVEAAGATCRKLGASTTLPECSRIYYQALAFEITPKSSGVTIGEEICVYNIDDPDFESLLMSCKSLQQTPDEQTKLFVQRLLSEEVPPKLVFMSVAPVFQESFPELDSVRVGAVVAYYGRQTDKPARLVTQEVKDDAWRNTMESIKQALGINVVKRELVNVNLVRHALNAVDEVIPRNRVEPERTKAFIDATRQWRIDGTMNIKLECFGGRTLLEAASLPEFKIMSQALLLLWEANSPASLRHSHFQDIHKQLHLSEPTLSAADDVFDLVGGAAYFWTDLSSIDPQSLIQLMQSALSRGVGVIYGELVSKAEVTQWPEEMQLSAEYTTLNLKARVVDDPNQADGLLMRIIETGKKLSLPIGNAVLERVQVLGMLNRNTEARQFLERSLRENPDDPALLEFVQAMMRQQAAARSQMGAAGSSGVIGDNGVAPSSAPSSGLWTPDQGSSTDGSASGSGSKLWVPGQD